MLTDRDLSINIRRFCAPDLEGVLELISHIDSPNDLTPTARAQFLREFDQPRDEEGRFVATYNGIIVGTMGCAPGPIPSKQVLWLDWLVVAPNYRRCHVASLLYRKIEELAIDIDKRCLCLDLGNIDGQRAAYLFHLKNGFQVVGQIPDYWGALQHLNIMAKFLLYRNPT